MIIPAQTPRFSPRSSPPTPRVTVGTPVFNGADYIEQALESLQNQTFADFELIISDNASTDGTSDICARFVQGDSRFRYVRQEQNIGPIPNFLFLLEQARGTYFMWAAADDYWADNWLSDLVAAIRPTDIVVRGTPVIVDEEGRLIERIPLRSHRRNSHLRLFMEDEALCRAYYFYGLYETAKLRAVGVEPLRDAPYGKDLLYLASMISVGDARHVDSTVQYCRRHASSAGTIEFSRTGWRRIVYRVQPFSYYRWTFKLSPATKKPLFLLAIPVKHAYLQAMLWRRGVLKLMRIVRGASMKAHSASARP
jgi:glycosyltransferase involved in cell wall biosynthesis